MASQITTAIFQRGGTTGLAGDDGRGCEEVSGPRPLRLCGSLAERLDDQSCGGSA
jgi:hypothetical protein